MPGFTALASRRAVSAGAVLVFAGGLALYQMTSLVLGQAGSRELHLSLAIPAADVDELSAPGHVGVNDTLGTLAGPVSGSVALVAKHPASRNSAIVHATPPLAVPAAVVASPSSPPPGEPASDHRAPPKRHDDH